MRIYLQSPGDAGAPPKYCQLLLTQDLLGGWILIREWGQTGGKVSVKREQYLDLSGAQEALMRQRDQQVKKGFKVVFAQGAEGHGVS